MRIRLLIDELPTKQEQQCIQLGADNLIDDSDEPEDIAWGADPFDIVAQREERGEFNHD